MNEMTKAHPDLDKARWIRYGTIVLLLHIIGVLLLIFKVRQYPHLMGFAFLAYTLGLRHAFDVDHIAAIDNVVRKLLQQQQNPAGVGFYFSLGHSTVVVIMAVITALSMNWAQRTIPQLKTIGSLIGTLVSGGFLLLIGIFNLIIWFDIFRLFREVQHGQYDAEKFETIYLSRGFLSRFFGPLYKLINQSWQVYPLGFLFGLGFDTASEVALLAVSANAVTQAIPVSTILALPILFAAGMSLLDTADEVFMTTAYHWAFATPLRKIYYNLTITGLSVVAALLIGLIELAQILIPQLNLKGDFWHWLAQIDFGGIGYMLVGLFILTWGISYVGWRLIEKKMS